MVAPLDAGVPEAVGYVRRLVAGLGVPWFLCGGWALDAWLGRQTRDHADVDIAVFHADQRAIYEQLAGWALVGHDPNVAGDSSEPWDGRTLDLPAHVHVLTEHFSLTDSRTTGRLSEFDAELMLEERAGDDWVLRRDPTVLVSLDRAVLESGWGLPIAAPEIVLFYKAGGHLSAAELATTGEVLRPHDRQDYDGILPELGEPAGRWLRETLAAVHPDHPWLAS